MLSCPQRQAMREETLANLRLTDWADDVTVVLDNSIAHRKEERQVETAERLIRVALAKPGWDYLLFLEDDLIFNRHLRHNLLNWRPVVEETVQLASLYNPSVGAVLQMRPFHYFIANAATIYGSQAFLIARNCLAHIAERYHEIPGLIDIKMARLAGERGPIFYHWPSLVQHVGRSSALGCVFHQALDFDLDFRAE
jgi:hypothetical protein